MTFEEDNEFWDGHIVGDEDCPACWRDWPRKCVCGKGLVHADFGDYIDAYNGSYYLEKHCDNPECDYCEVDD